ncbi:hypothetical protein KP509_29G039500 [Ceratopteris richardii]|uniref:Bifunctional inhibitor/plant lipid transfer protein/seed storage helical domain-containing protein n=1 Tax=Ceratopteris richardii TaxID=49495 RepID=A0A8T2R8H9_CERRI|nr:hypothetical protein KP509_29G039500 [Ceratopteris richardii]
MGKMSRNVVGDCQKAVLASIMLMVMVGATIVESGCPSSTQLANACSQYVIGKNPPPPPSSGGCCSLLRSGGASCLCSNIPPSARSLVSKKAIDNIRSSCKLNFRCPGTSVLLSQYAFCLLFSICSSPRNPSTRMINELNKHSPGLPLSAPSQAEFQCSC